MWWSKTGYLSKIFPMLVFLIILFMIFLFVVYIVIPNKVEYSGNDSAYSEQVALNVANLSLMNLETVDSAEKYQTFADNTNNLIRILNEETDWFKILELKNDPDSWYKVSNALTEYAPLIDNYNGVVSSAKMFEQQRNDKNLQNFYIASTWFGFETITILGTVFYPLSFDSVGAVYRGSGLQTLAFECSSCVSIALSTSHWIIRTELVEASSLTAKKISEMNASDLDIISMDSIKNEAEAIVESRKAVELKEVMNNTVNTIKNETNGLFQDFQNSWNTTSLNFTLYNPFK